MNSNKNTTKLIATLAVFSILMPSASHAASNYNYSQPQSSYGTTSPLYGQVVFVPIGTSVPVVLATPISSEAMTLGTGVSATMPQAFVYNGKTIAPAGSMVYGTVTMVKPAGKANRNAQMQIKFNSIATPQGFNIPISAVIMTDDGTGILKGGTKMDATKDFAKNTAVGAAGGAILGTALGPLSGGSVGKGAVYGTAVGAGLGLAKGLVMDRGEAIQVPANSTVNLYFDQPVTISAPMGYDY